MIENCFACLRQFLISYKIRILYCISPFWHFLPIIASPWLVQLKLPSFFLTCTESEKPVVLCFKFWTVNNYVVHVHSFCGAFVLWLSRKFAQARFQVFKFNKLQEMRCYIFTIEFSDESKLNFYKKLFLADYLNLNTNHSNIIAVPLKWCLWYDRNIKWSVKQQLQKRYCTADNIIKHKSIKLCANLWNNANYFLRINYN